MTDVELSIPLSGKLVKAVVGSFCMKPVKDDDSYAHMSLGVAENSVVATDSNSAIQIGADAEIHVATRRKEALLEAERSCLYGTSVRLPLIERKTDDQTGEVEQMPHVQAAILSNLGRMDELASVDPSALVAIGKVAIAAGAHNVKLFQPRGDLSVLGFTFSFEPETNLFEQWDTAIEVRGIFRATAAARSRVREEEAGDVTDLVPATNGHVGRSTKEALAAIKERIGDTDEGVRPPHEVEEPEPEVVLEPIDVDLRVKRGAILLAALSVLEPRPTDNVELGAKGDGGG